MQYQNWHGVHTYSEDFTDIPALKKKKLVYLTADSDELLTTFDPDCAYIIGGIVDRNRLKGITLKKAIELNIATARLPIRENYDLTSSQVLTVNHVYSIMKKFSELSSWKKAIGAVIPERKVKEEDEEVSSDEKLEKENCIDDEDSK